MKIKFLHIMLLYVSVLFSTEIRAQISPGDLAKGHADLEGISNCTQCHTLGEKVSNNKCLDCHKEIKNRIDKRTGFHASKEVKGKECASCHSDHHGRKFDMVRFDEDNFDHNLTTYELTGAHKTIDCRQCHIPDYIDDPELKKRADTFLGLEQECIDCHTDVHQNTLTTNDCTKCHSTNVFSPAEKFDHDDTDFFLAGKHADVDCIECHQKEIRNGEEFQHFAEVDFKNCNSCHDDAHNNNLGTDCKSCHTEESFTSLAGIKKFNHNKTNFPLKGKHKATNCADCHQMKAITPLTVFQDQLGIHTDDCIKCHEDVHDNKFGTNCVECHNEESFNNVRTDNFNHSKTGFELVGKHETVDCRECHKASFTEPLPHEDCAACHVDYHEGQFVDNGISPDCKQCHTEEGFEFTLFTFENHSETKFPLDGAHTATPCFECHLQEDRWEFRGIGERCVDCHEDVHAGFINEKFYPDQTCEKCHVSSSWVENNFDHNLTEFELSGVHAETECMACHATEEADSANKYTGFLEFQKTCYECHENTHEQQFEINGITDCARCHGFESWGVEDFNHDKTAFKLEGKHAEIECNACHKEVVENDKIFIQYKFENFECVVCHQ